MTTQASQTRSKNVQPVGGGTPMTGTCTVGVIQAKLSLFGLGMLVLGCLLVDTSWAQSEVSFTRQDFGVGDGPSSVAVGDFNGDGQQDVATANLDVDSVSILINNTAAEITVKIDVKPGSFPNSINPRSKGVIPVAVLTTDTFDASAVDATTVFFGAIGNEAAPAHSALEDVDGDGHTDMILHFRTQDTGIVCGNTSASLTGSTFSGQAIEGSDSIRTVGCK
jgi:FG-GAP repeat